MILIWHSRLPIIFQTFYAESSIGHKDGDDNNNNNNNNNNDNNNNNNNNNEG